MHINAYAGRPFSDSRHVGPQRLPGRLQCAAYDLGGEGVAYHDSTPANQGSGTLNPADGSYLNEFRRFEAVDTSFTKGNWGASATPIDNTPFNRVQPEMGQLYVGWTEPGEWLNYTVEIAAAGPCAVDVLYTSRHGGAISLSLDGTDISGLITLESTEDRRDPLDWRQWHHWDLRRDAARAALPAGRHVLTLHTRERGQMNYAWLDFRPS